jgi:transcriptional repressor NrdR
LALAVLSSESDDQANYFLAIESVSYDQASKTHLNSVIVDRNLATEKEIHRMKCPYCKLDNDKVIDSRSSDDGFSIRRRRRCLECEKRFTTYERVAELDIQVVKKDGSRQPFRPEKIRKGVERACWKRPIPTDQVENAIAQIIQGVYLQSTSEIDSQLIGEMVMEMLVELDDVAYIRFASVYREFRDIEDFFNEVRPILENRGEKARMDSE